MTAFSTGRAHAHPAMVLPLFVGTAAWGVLLVGVATGNVAPPVGLNVLAVGPPLLLGLVALLAEPGPRRVLGPAALAAAVVGGSVLAAVYVGRQPLYALALPAAAGAAYGCARRPDLAVATAFALTGAFNTLEVFTPIPVGESVDLLLLGLWIATGWRYLTTSRDRPVWLWPGVVLTLLYLALTLLQVFAADSLEGGLYSFRVSCWYLAAFILVGYAEWTPQRIQLMTRSVALTAVAVGGYALFRWLFGQSGQELEAGVAAAGQYNTVNGEERLIGSFPTGHHLGAWMAIVTPFCFALALTWKDRWRWIAMLATGLCTVALLASEVRSALLAGVLGVAIVLALYQAARGFRGPHLGVTTSAVVLAVGLGVAAFSLTIVSDADQQRYSNLLNPSADPAVQGRVTKWTQALDDIRDYPLGRGLGSSGEAEQRYSRFVTLSSYQLDNSYLHIATQQGTAMLLLYAIALVALLAGLMRRAVQIPSRVRSGVAIGASGSLAGLATLMLTGLYIEGLPALAGWLIVGLGVAQFAPSKPADRTPHA